MPATVPKGSWVEIHRVVLPAGERAPQVPAETQAVPLEMLARGRLAEAAEPGDEVEIVTAAGRRLQGTLVEARPAYAHGFGQPIDALVPVGSEVRALLSERGPGA